MPRYRLLALDIDGTLVNSRDELTDDTRSALRRARAAGVHIVLATGRRYSRALPLVEPLELNVPLVTASGALVKRAQDHRTLHRAAFGEGVVEATLVAIAEAGYEPIAYADTYEQGFDFYCLDPRPSEPLLAEFLTYNAGFERVNPELVQTPPSGVFSLFAMGTRDAMLVLADRLEVALPGQLSMHVLRSPRYRGFMCEVAPRGESKWASVLRLAQEWHIGPDQICAVGDDVNDIPMIAGAGLGVAMGNALEVVKESADRIAPSHDEDGLVEVVRWITDSASA